MSVEPLDYLRRILAEADYLVERRHGLTFDDFPADETLRRAFVRSLEIIGEAARDVVQNRIPELRRQIGTILET